ncbi:hypothetical protein HZS_7698 [Henneguya salminicola]|nr:hypothetical protein HZS_7698 [Henneguya salminicola]
MTSNCQVLFRRFKSFHLKNEKRNLFENIASNKKPIIYEKSKLFSFSQDQVFDVVKNVDSYKVFLPYCEESSIYDIKENTAKGTMTVGCFGVREIFQSFIEFEKPNYVISTSKGGIFDTLVSHWKFNEGLTDRNQTCNVNFRLKGVIKSHLYFSLIALNLLRMSEHLITSFEKRCFIMYQHKLK